MVGFYTVLLFIFTGAFLVSFTVALSRFFAPTKKSPEKLIPYECGELPQGDAWIQFNNRFYIVALIFLIFDVEVLFLFPWAVVFNDMGLLAFVEMFIFIVILLVGYAYVWVKGDLDWIKPKPRLEHLAKGKGE